MSDQPTAKELEQFMFRSFPNREGEPRMRIEVLEPEKARLRLRFNDRMLRPGGTISGPVLMSLADSVLYVLVMHNLGMKAASAVTSNLTISFLRRPAPADLIGEGRLLKLGRRLAMGDVILHSEGAADPVAHATVTYALPAD